MKYLTRHVRGQLCAAGEQAWRDLGRELIPDGEEAMGTIAVNAHGNVITCCESVFKLWLERQPEASWGQLIQGLKDVQLDNLATQVERKLEPSIHTTTTIVSQLPKGMIRKCTYSYRSYASYKAHKIATAIYMQPSV